MMLLPKPLIAYQQYGTTGGSNTISGAAGAATPAGGQPTVDTTSGAPINPATGQPYPYIASSSSTLPQGYMAPAPMGPSGAPSYLGGGTFLPGSLPTGPPVQPKYYAGQQWGGAPGFPNPADTQAIIQLQQQLIAANMLDPRQVLLGQWTSVSASAFAELLGLANIKGTDWQSALAGAMSTASQYNTLQQRHVPDVVTLTNPDDIRGALKSAARSLYGGDLNEAQTQAFITQFQAQERAAQNAAYTARYGSGNYLEGQSAPQGPGGDVTASPGASGLALEAQQAIKQTNPTQVFQSAFGSAMKNLLPGLAQAGGGWV